MKKVLIDKLITGIEYMSGAQARDIFSSGCGDIEDEWDICWGLLVEFDAWE